MKRLFIISFLLSVCFSASSQPKIGITAGYIYSHLIDGDGKTFESDELMAKLHGQSGYYIGMYADNQVNDRLLMQYSVQFVNSGGMLEAHLKGQGTGFMSRVNLNQPKSAIRHFF